jgi:16S rRNA (guanine527-N7)-methyltransferase
MNQGRISELLKPFLDSPLSDSQLSDISTYIDILLRWNAKMNLTSVRNPEEIVTRHFGESLFAAQEISKIAVAEYPGKSIHLIDIGSGAGFPGLPIKIFDPAISVTLIESSHKKVAFLREVIRELDLREAAVFANRAESYEEPVEPDQLMIVTLRAVEHYQEILGIAVRLLNPPSYIALLIGENQIEPTQAQYPDLKWRGQLEIPLSSRRSLLLGTIQ